MKKIFFLILTFYSSQLFSQKLLLSWGQQDIQNYTQATHDDAQKLTSSELLQKNLDADSWSSVFSTLNASINNYSKDSVYLTALAKQVSNNKETMLQGTSRLIIWDRISSGDIIFEGKGLIIDNDLYKVGGRANQLLQSLTKKNFGFVNIHSNKKDLEELQQKWLKYLSNMPVNEYQPPQYKNAKIAKICTPSAVQALIVSLQPNEKKEQIIKSCLQKVYHLDEMPKEKGSMASYCNPDLLTYSYLGIIFGNDKFYQEKDADWWKNFWERNQNKLEWNNEKGIYEVD